MGSYGLTREFFTEQAPAMRDPLKLDDRYKQVDGKAKNILLSELQELQRSAPVKRVSRGDGGGPLRKKLRGDGEGDAAEGDEADDAVQFKTKDAAPKKKVRVQDLSKTSLTGWVKKEEKKDEDG